MKFGFSYIGFVYLLLLFVPNILWTKNQPRDYEKYVENENRILSALERVGEVLVSTTALIFADPDVGAVSIRHLWLFVSFACMVFYECYWVRYFRSDKTMKDFYSSFLGMPVAGATYPVIAFFLLGIYKRNIVLIVSAVVLGVGHIGIHLDHGKEIE